MSVAARTYDPHSLKDTSFQCNIQAIIMLDWTVLQTLKKNHYCEVTEY